MPTCNRRTWVVLLLATVWGCGGSEEKPLVDGSPPLVDGPPAKLDTGAGGGPGTDGPLTPDGPTTDVPASDGPSGDAPAGDAPVAQGSVHGRVFVAGSGLPVVGATVRGPGGATATSNAQGVFSLAALPEGTVVLNAEANALATTFKPVDVAAGQTSYVELFLPPVDVQSMVNATSGGEVRSVSTGARAVFPANSLVDSAGNMVQGNVQISLSSINPANVEERRAFPGEFRAIRTNSSEVAIETYGPMEITATKDGQPLDLMPGVSAEISFPIYDNDAPDTIELWSLNEATGIWKEEGVAYRTTDDQGHPIYRATIGHMSWWNPDRPIERTCVRTCVTSNGAPVPGAMVSALGVGYGYEANGYAGDDGCISLRVQRNRQVTLHAAAMGGVSPSILVSAPDTVEPSDPASCMAVPGLALAPRPADGCPGGMTKCGERCVDTTNSPNNCGACDTTCGGDLGPDGSSCVMGVCACASNQVNCNGYCIDPKSDRNNCGGCSAGGPAVGTESPCVTAACCTDMGLSACQQGDRYLCTNHASDRYNCGACGVACETGQECKNSACAAIVCPSGQTLCGNRCVQGNNCGETCEGGQQCTGGTCAAIVCPESLTVCYDGCADTQRDAANCGGCGNRCEQEGAVCNAGTCACGPGATECTVGSNLTACANLASDRYHCGTCGTVCPSGTVCSSGQCQSLLCPQGQIQCGESCFDPSTSSQHCGGCAPGFTDRDEPQECPAGQCECPQGWQECPFREAAACFNLQNDDESCGQCGMRCESGQRCLQGSCQAIVCPPGSVLCGEVCVPGTTCGESCAANDDNSTCVAGKCACPTGWKVCEGNERTVCTEIATDEQHCGDCGNECQTGFECLQGQCQAIVCPQGQIWCGSSCVNTQSDQRHCGGCALGARAGLGCQGEGCCLDYGLTGCGGGGENESFTCTSLVSDSYNCGSCGTRCAADQVCEEGSCVALACPAGQVACDHECLPGTTCGTTCYEGQICTAGTCQAGPAN